MKLLREWLEEAHDRWNRPEFIEPDPVSIPHRFSRKEDIEIAGFFAAMLAWGQRKTIVKSANALMERMDWAPADFVLRHTPKDLDRLAGFVHRTFNGQDAVFFVQKLQPLYQTGGGLEGLICQAVLPEHENVAEGLRALFAYFFGGVAAALRSRKHLPDIERGSAAKRMNMYLRWLARRDKRGVDFGLWPGIRPAQLLCPLDVHVGRTARKYGLLHRTQNDWQAVLELTAALRAFDAEDPVRFDFALFGLSVSEKGED